MSVRKCPECGTNVSYFSDAKGLDLVCVDCMRSFPIGDKDSGDAHLIGYGGLENIEWENSRAEISLLIGPDFRGQGKGREAVGMILEQAFSFMNLHSVHGECYECGPVDFWDKLIDEWREEMQVVRSAIPHAKFYNGEYYDSMYFTFIRGE